MNPDPFLTSTTSTKFNSRQTVDLSMNGETIKLLNNDTGKYLNDRGAAK